MAKLSKHWIQRCDTVVEAVTVVVGLVLVVVVLSLMIYALVTG